MFSNNSSEKPINILKASLPYIPINMQRTISYFVKIEEFNLMIQNFNDSFDDTLSACSSSEDNKSFNPQGLLNAIKPYLDSNEKELIDMFYNFMNAMNIYNVYRSMPEDFKSGFNFNNDNSSQNTSTSETSPEYFFSKHDEENNMPNQYDEPLQAASSDDIADATSNNKQYEFYDENIQYINSEQNNAQSKSNCNDSLNSNNATSQNYSTSQTNSSYETNHNSSNSQNNGFNIETLKSLLNPSQRAMFDTYSAMLNKN